MKQLKNKGFFFVIISMLFFIGCNEPSTTSNKNDMDTTPVVTKSDTSAISMPAYDPAMEPLTVGAKYSKKIGDTLNMKMYEFIVKPGDSVALHSHPDHAIYVLQGGKAAITLQGKDRQVVDLKTGTGFIHGPVSDAGKNIGTTNLKLLLIEIYRPQGK